MTRKIPLLKRGKENRVVGWRENQSSGTIAREDGAAVGNVKDHSCMALGVVFVQIPESGHDGDMKRLQIWMFDSVFYLQQNQILHLV